MVHGLHYSPIFIQLTCTIPFISTYLHAIINPMLVMMMRMEYSVGPDQLASEKPADLDLHCFQNRLYPGLAW